MKKLIIFVLTFFLTFTIILSGKSVNAELTPITPFYGGDIFNGQELYLFQNYSATPNFQNGYISKQTITNQDVHYQENSYYNGWYKNLGEDLIYEYTGFPEQEVENPYFWFYVTLNDLLAQYFQFALIAPEPFEGDYYIKFKNENPINFLTTNGYNDYLVLPPTTDMAKEIEWFCFEVYFPDYMASFRPLTAQLAYEFGFSAGEMSGYDRGYNTGYTNGYNTGHTDGYNEGSIDTQYGVNTVVNFNQIVKNGNFTNTNNWYTQNSSFSVDKNTAYILSNGQNGRIYQFLEPTLITGHKYAIFGNLSANLDMRLFDTVHSLYINYYSLPMIITSDYNYNQLWLYDRRTDNWDTVTAQNVMIFDLTTIYGDGNEPTNIETVLDDFPSNYYPYTTTELINIDYENGYIKGQKLGYNLGYDDGKDAQATQQLTSTGWISSIFGGISSLLNIQIFPGVTIGIIVGIPFVISLAYFVIRAFRGGGGD